MSADFQIVNHGSIFTFTPLSPSAVEHCAEFFPADCPTFGPAFCVEHRFAQAIAADLLDHGFEVE